MTAGPRPLAPDPRPDQRDAFERDGFVVVDRLLGVELLAPLRDAFDRLFAGRFATGTAPDEVNWQTGSGDPTRTRQICNGWKADPTIAEVVLDGGLGRAIAKLAGWPGARLVQDNVLWKPPGASSLGFHRDNWYQAWHRPRELVSCWLALDATSSAGGAVEFARGSHRWPPEATPEPEFHAPANHRAALVESARQCGEEIELRAVEVAAGGGSFHHGWTWHGSGPNTGTEHRRALVLHCTTSDATFERSGFGHGTGPIYTRYARLTDDVMDEHHFPIPWRYDGYRTPGLPGAPA